MYNSAQQYISLIEKNNEQKSYLIEKSYVSTEPNTINKSYTTFTNKSPLNYHDYRNPEDEKRVQSLEEEKVKMDKEMRKLTEENHDLREKINKNENKSLLERKKYEEKLLEINSELNKRLVLERNNKKPIIKNTDGNKMLEKLIDDMKKENTFVIETLKKDHEKTVEMYELLIKEMEYNIAELLKKNGMLNLSLKEMERKNNELSQINKTLYKKNHQLEAEKLQ